MGDLDAYPWNVKKEQRCGAYFLGGVAISAYVAFCAYILVQAIQGVRYPESTITYHPDENIRCPDIRICYDGVDVVFANMEIFATFHESSSTFPWDEDDQQLSMGTLNGPYFLNNTFVVSNVSNIPITQNDKPFYGYDPPGLDYLKTICWDFTAQAFYGNNSVYLDILFRFNSYNATNVSQPLAPSFVWTTLYHDNDTTTPYDGTYKATTFDVPTMSFTQIVLQGVYKDKLWGRKETWYRTTNLQTNAFRAEDTAVKNLLQIGYTFDQEGALHLAEINTLSYTTLLSQWAGVWTLVPAMLMVFFVSIQEEERTKEEEKLNIRFTRGHRRKLVNLSSKALRLSTRSLSRRRSNDNVVPGKEEGSLGKEGSGIPLRSLSGSIDIV